MIHSYRLALSAELDSLPGPDTFTAVGPLLSSGAFVFIGSLYYPVTFLSHWFTLY